jgi:hypothetical protein
MKGKTATAAVVIALAAPASAGAAPLSPSAQFAYNVAGAQWGGSGCGSVDAQIVPAGPPEIVAEYSRPGEPCFVYLSRDVAGSGSFAKACKALVFIIGTWHGVSISTARLPRICLAKTVFLLNHPHYLRRRFR